MDWNDSRYRLAATAADEFAGLVFRALDLEILAKLFRVHVVGLLVDINELRKRACLRNGFSSCDESVGHSHDDVAGLDSASHEGKTQSIGSVAQSDGMVGVAEFRKRTFEFFDHGTTDKTGRRQNFVKNRGELLFELPMWSDQI